MVKKKKKSRYLWGFWVMDTTTQQKQVDIKNLHTDQAKFSFDTVWNKYK